METTKIVIRGDSTRKAAHELIDEAKAGSRITIEPPKRSIEQNAKMWAMLSEVSDQVDWYGNKLTPEEWKDVFSASIKKQKVVPGIDSGFVVCGQRTSKMSVQEMADLITLMEAFGAEQGVKFAAWEYEGEEV